MAFWMFLVALTVVLFVIFDQKGRENHPTALRESISKAFKVGNRGGFDPPKKDLIFKSRDEMRLTKQDRIAVGLAKGISPVLSFHNYVIQKSMIKTQDFQLVEESAMGRIPRLLEGLAFQVGK